MEVDFSEIPTFWSWKTVTPVEKGWSSDKKYKITTHRGERLLLRLTPAANRPDKEKEYAIVCKYAAQGIPMSVPVDFGLCDHGNYVYMLLTWVDGRDLEQVLPGLPEQEQYRLGCQAGRILRMIHEIPVAPGDLPTQTKAEKKLSQLERYAASGIRVPGDEAAMAFVRSHIHRIWQEKPVYQHGDFHPGNLIYRPDGNLGVIDFNRWEVGDPYEEFYKLQSFGVEVSAAYCVGQIQTYFSGRVPDGFWEALAVYVAHASLFSIVWALPFGPEDVAGMVRRWEAAWEDYDGFQRMVPKWYRDLEI